MLFDCQSFVLQQQYRLSLAYINQGCFRRSSCSHAGAECFGRRCSVKDSLRASLRVCSAATSLLGPRAARPTSRLFLGPRALRFLYTAVTAHGALTFPLPHNHITTPPHVVYISTSDVLLKLHAATSTFLCTATLPCFHISDCRYTAVSPSLFLCCQSAMLSQFHVTVFH